MKIAGRFIVVCCCALVWACTKTDSDGGVSPNPAPAQDTSHPTAPGPVLISGNAFDKFLQPGFSATYLRTDTLAIDIRSPNATFGVRWINGRKPVDSIVTVVNNVVQAIVHIYRDSSNETITVTGRTDFGSIKKLFPAQYQSLGAYPFYYLRDSLKLSDTALLSTWIVTSPAHNTVDTAYAYRSAAYFTVFPSYASSGIAESINYSTKLPVPKGDPVFSIMYGDGFYSTADTSLIMNGKTYMGISFIRDHANSHSGNGFLSSNLYYDLHFAQALGLLRYYNYRSSYQYMFGGSSYSTLRRFLN